MRVDRFQSDGLAAMGYAMAVAQGVGSSVVDEDVNDLLVRWHQWAAGYEFAHGYASQSAMFRQTRSSRQYDDANGSLDAHVDAVLMEAVDAVASDVPQPHYTALAMFARNLSTGAQVWSSPRLPSDPIKRTQLVAEARKMFSDGLAKAGLI